MAGLLSFGAIASAMPEDKARLEAQETRSEAVQELQKVETKNELPKEEKPLETPKEQPEKQNISKVPVQKPVHPEAQPPQPIAQTTSIAPVGITDRGGVGSGVGSCAAEIAKYPWNQSLATAVSTAESGMNPGIVNHNPSTQDYSVGCFQVNLWGDLAKSRPSEEQLRDAAVNVKWAYDNYIRNGRSFKGQWGVCGVKVDCDTGLTIRK